MSDRVPPASDPGQPGSEYRDALARALRGLRQKHGWSLRELSGRSGLSVPYLSELERALKAPSPEGLVSLSRAYGLTLAGLLRAIADELEPPAAAGPEPSVHADALTGLTPDDLHELVRYAAYLRWRRQQSGPQTSAS